MADMSTYRTGGHWQRTIVRVGTQPADHDGRRPDDALVGMVDTPELAERIVKALNFVERADRCRWSYDCEGTPDCEGCPTEAAR
jgi:hypothetical protein